MILLVSPFRDQGSQFRMSTKIIVYIAIQYCKQEVMRQKLTLKSIQFVYCPGTVTPTFPSLVPANGAGVCWSWSVYQFVGYRESQHNKGRPDIVYLLPRLFTGRD